MLYDQIKNLAIAIEVLLRQRATESEADAVRYLLHFEIQQAREAIDKLNDLRRAPPNSEDDCPF